jgi:pyrimidine-specific ribonucleoside hydrolase
MAIANKDKLNILGITTVGGNKKLDEVTQNTLRLLSFVNEDIPVAAGEALPLSRDKYTIRAGHGHPMIEDPMLPNSKVTLVSTNGVQFMYEKIMSSKQKVTIIPIGPLTNIALLLKIYPNVKENIEDICLMGGGVYKGNRTPVAEFNVYSDPEAAKMVFSSGVDIIMAGLDASENAVIFKEELEQLGTKGKVSCYVQQLLSNYVVSDSVCRLHDPCTIAYLLQPEIFKGQRYNVDVETKGELTKGMTVVDVRANSNKPANAYVLLDVNRLEFAQLVINSLEKLDKMVDNN